ncbi:uncharacterized protein SPSK_07883 [Sporothrix schenckii 1099-18]|uniref:Zn(2)-C6 fungal-type domain-containing protein n=1 Tax=Sporothrix schenckii 1099-18 TaxID=1397361 RepID=A0A0F2MH31_SPOSC|nr:uncharacterized protein SPSK_07883 [Sporothrix schenckii 1099-18]KJR88165.1 hypothetical protein SPSK_07883 [Sporothrix schenckii 1099-18]
MLLAVLHRGSFATCDETHPTCNNCKKSKRDCAGYDPIFKQQQNNPAFLQATAHVSPQGSSTTTATAPEPRPKSPPPVPYSSVATSSAASNSVANSAGIKSPSIVGGPSSLSSASSNSGSTASSYYNGTGSSSAVTSYQSSHSGNNIGNGSHHESTDHKGHNSSTSYGPVSHSPRPVVSSSEYHGTAFDSTYIKEEPRRTYWPDRTHHDYPNNVSDSRDAVRYTKPYDYGP